MNSSAIGHGLRLSAANRQISRSGPRSHSKEPLARCRELEPTRNIILIISFNSRSLRDSCASLERAEALIGYAHAQELITLLSDAEAQETAADLMEFYAPDATDDGDTISLRLGTQYQLRFVAVGSAPVGDSGAGLDWRTVRRLKLMEISRC